MRPDLSGAPGGPHRWGLVGLCPGPAVAAIGLGGWPVWLFVGAMALGMGLHARVTRPHRRPA